MENKGGWMDGWMDAAPFCSLDMSAGRKHVTRLEPGRGSPMEQHHRFFPEPGLFISCLS